MTHFVEYNRQNSLHIVEYIRQEKATMNHEILKKVILDQQEVIKNFEIINREVQFEDKLNYVLVGLRRAGKSTMMYQAVQNLITQGADWEQIIYINFEDERLSEFTLNDFNDILLTKSMLTDKKAYYFFDEIQNIKGWEKFARRLADEKAYVRITGSNAKMLSHEISGTLGGRYISRYISTYSFEEFLKARGLTFTTNDWSKTSRRGKLIKLFDEYYTFGGYPESVDLMDKRGYVSNVYQKVILGDVAARNEIRNEMALRLLVKKIAESVRSEISFSKLHNSLKSIGVSISKDTVIEYVNHIKNSYLIFDIRNYYAAFVDKESNPKYYFGDNGLLNLFLTNGTAALLENVVAICLHNMFGDKLFYIKSAKTGIDVDFYVPEENLAIQVAYSIEGEAREREVGNLCKLARENPGTRLLILTYSEEDRIEDGGTVIEVVPCAKYFSEIFQSVS